MPVVEHSVNYHSIVREWPPVGSDFSPRGGYTTPDGVTITKTMRDKVKALKLEYGSRGEQDLHRQRVTPLSPRTIRQEAEEPQRAARFADAWAGQSDNRVGPRSGRSGTSGGPTRSNQQQSVGPADNWGAGQSANSAVGASVEILPRTSSGNNRTNQVSGN